MHRQDPYPITALMLHIANNPSNPWLKEWIKAHNVKSHDSEPVIFETPQEKAKDSFIKHLAGKVKA